ncbi:MAG: FimV/HubP family polar landmark protein [Gammaproteobacteria bacterium]
MTRNDKIPRHAYWLPLLLCLPGLAHALSLGDVAMRSFLMEPLVAEIPLRAASPTEVEDVRVRLAEPAEFDRFGIERTRLHDDMRFEVESRGDAWMVIVRTLQPVREPYLAFPVSAVWRDGQVLREYTVFVDPRPLRNAATAAPRAAVAQATPRPPTARPQTVRERYGPVQRGETAWPIARRLKPAGVTTEQMLMALQRVNPEAFVGGNVNNLRAGAVLRVPNAEDLAAVTPAAARGAFAAQNEAWRNRGRAPEPGAPATAVAATQPPASAPKPAQVAQPEAATESELRILEGQAEPAAEAAPTAHETAGRAELERRLLLTLESAEATRLEFQSLNEEVERLTSQMDRMQRLLELKERQIAALTTVKGSRAVAQPAAGPSAAALPQREASPSVASVAASVPPPEAADLLQNWWLAAVVVILLLLILVLLVLLWRRPSGQAQGGLPEQDRPYAHEVAAYSVAGIGTAATTEAELAAEFAEEDAQRFLDELERSAPPARPASGAARSTQGPALVNDDPFAISDDDIAALGSELDDAEETDSWLRETSGDDEAQAGSAEIDALLTDLEVEEPPGGSERVMSEPVVDREEELPDLDVPLDVDALDEVELEAALEQAADRAEDHAAAGVEDDAEAMELKLELARAYLEIGDVEGAREILDKVVEGSMSGDQLTEAKELLNALK